MSGKHGCFNRPPFRTDLIVPNGRVVDPLHSELRIPIVTGIPFTMSLNCQHDRRHTDARCEGCRWIDGNDEDIRKEYD